MELQPMILMSIYRRCQHFAYEDAEIWIYTVYYLFGTHQRLLQTDGTYSGDTAFLIVYDISGDRIIRIEKYVCANMFVYDANLFVTGSDGKYYKPYLKTE